MDKSVMDREDAENVVRNIEVFVHITLGTTYPEIVITIVIINKRNRIAICVQGRLHVDTTECIDGRRRRIGGNIECADVFEVIQETSLFADDKVELAVVVQVNELWRAGIAYVDTDTTLYGDGRNVSKAGVVASLGVTF